MFEKTFETLNGPFVQKWFISLLWFTKAFEHEERKREREKDNGGKREARKVERGGERVKDNGWEITKDEGEREKEREKYIRNKSYFIQHLRSVSRWFKVKRRKLSLDYLGNHKDDSMCIFCHTISIYIRPFTDKRISFYSKKNVYESSFRVFSFSPPLDYQFFHSFLEL